jgi:ABC-type nitrate/sulfonate/bicarbonate transport system substrate-binding protein
MPHRRGIGAVAIIATAALALTACSSTPSGSGGQEKTSLTVAYGTAGSSLLPLFVAQDEGMFGKHGLSVKVTLAASTVGATAVLSGSADLFMGEVTSAFQAAAQHQPMELVGVMLDKSINRLYVRPSVTSPKQLEGSSVAISATGDSTDIAMRLALKQLGVSTQHITFLDTGGSSARLSALIAGRVQGTVLSDPSATEAGKQGMRLLYDQTSLPFADDGITISKSFGDQNPTSVESFLKAIVDAVHYIDDPANKQTVLQVLAKYTQAKPTSAPVEEGYETYTKILAKDPFPETQAGASNLAGLKDESPSQFASVTVGQVYDTKFAQQLRSSGYLKQVWGKDFESS